MGLERAAIDSIIIEHADIGYDQDSVVFQDIDTSHLPPGVLWIRGGTGSGKTTFLRFLSGILPPLKGSLRINGLDVFGMEFNEFLPYRLNIGFGFELGGLLSNKTLEENLSLPLEYHNVGTAEERKARIDEMMSLFGMSRYRNMRPAHIPGGVRKAGCVARAFILDPEVVVLDDPSEGLGPVATQGLLNLIRKRLAARQLKYVVISSSNVNFISELPGTTLLLVGQTMMMLGEGQDALV